MARRGTIYPFTPKSSEPFNVIVSIQYRGLKGDHFKKVSFSSRTETQRAIRVLRLEEDLSELGLPRLQGVDSVIRSSLNYPLTLEILYIGCELGQSSEQDFHSFHDRFSREPGSLESMRINSVFIYFLMPNVKALAKSHYALYALRRPKAGWNTWLPDRDARRAFPSRDEERHRLPPSQREHPHVNSPHSMDRSSTQVSTRKPGTPAQTTSGPSIRNGVTDGDTHSPLPVVVSSAEAPVLDVPVALSDPASISSAIQTLSKSLTPLAPTPMDQPEERPVRAEIPTPIDASVNAHRDQDKELNSLRVEYERNTIVCDLQQKHIRELQQEVIKEREARSRAEAQLQAEQRLLEVERRKLEDVRQEYAAPFIVPALLDAFLGVSH